MTTFIIFLAKYVNLNHGPIYNFGNFLGVNL